MKFTKYIICAAISAFAGGFILGKVRTLNPKDRETVKQALRYQIEDIRNASCGCYGEELPALSGALCEVVDRLKTL